MAENSDSIKLGNNLKEMTSTVSDIPFIKKIQGLIFGRLALILLLLLASWWWTNSYLQLSQEFFPVHLFLLFVLSLFLTFIYLLFLRFDQNYLWQVRIQLLIDILLITSLVWGTGDLISPYVTLYIVLICVAGFFLGSYGTIFIAGLCAGCFTLIPILTSQQFIFSLSGGESMNRSFQIIAFNNVSILIVGLIAGRFSDRQKINQQLKQTTESFTDLHILHERVVESIGSGIITTGLDGKIYDLNPAAEKIIGHSPERILRDNIFSLFGAEIKPKVSLCLENMNAGEVPNEQFETTLETADQLSKTISCTVAPLIGKNGNPYGLIFAFQDMTEFREMEENLRRSDRLAAIGRMAAGLAHEVRNPLGSMGSALQFLQQKMPPDSTELTLMEVVLHESDRLNHIISNFLTYARSSGDDFSPDKLTEVDLDQLIEECLILLRHSPEVTENHLVEYKPPKTKPIIIKANATEIKQVFWNLARNSIQAMNDGGSLQISLKTAGKNKIQMIFEDSGQGISPEHLEHLFEPFSAYSKGTGLGLSIVHNIISNHSGNIEVKSELGKGTRISVELPC